MRQNNSEASYTTSAGTGERRRAFKRLRLHRQFVPLFVLVTLLSTLGIAGLAYIGSRAAAISSAQTRAAQDAQVLRDELTARGAPLRLSDGRFVVGTGATALTLNDDTTIVDQTHTMLSADSTIYELESGRLVAISTTIPAAGSDNSSHGARDLGDALPANITAALLGSCGQAAPPTCYRSYDGVASFAGRQYVVDAVPLFDATGAFVGAVSAALPLDLILAPTVQLSVMLLLVGALLALVSLAGGTWIYGARIASVLDQLDSRLNRLADAAGDLEHLAHAQVDRSSRQSFVARQITEQVRTLDAMAQVMEQGHASLRDSTSEMWAEISQPGMAPDVARATRRAQQTAIAAARVGSAAGDARDLCRQLLAQMNHVAAEAGMVTESGHALEQRAQDLRTAVEGVEMTLGERLRQRNLGSSLPLVRRVRSASQHLRRFLPTRAGAPGKHPTGPFAATRAGAPQQAPANATFDAPRSATGHHAAAPRTFGSLRAVNQRSASSGELPHPARDASRDDPAASLPRSVRRSPNDAGASSSGAWPPNRPHTSGWLDR